MTLISELLDLPNEVNRGDFVLKLSEGITDEHAQATIKDYVVTDSLKKNFDDALRFIKGAVDSRSSKGAYLHGSFGSGKSHFMAVLYLLLNGNTTARSIPEMASVVAAHGDWTAERRFLLVPYHMIGARSMESAILGQYVSFVRKLHPGAPLPGVYLSEDLFANAQGLRKTMGDGPFFGALNARASAAGGAWGNIATSWDAATFAAALGAPADDEARVRLVGDLIETLFPAYAALASSEGQGFVPLDGGLSIISQHAHGLGYDGVILFLDELVLWLASHSADQAFVTTEGQKLAKLVEAQDPNRPIPIISFVARQRDLRDLIGTQVPGAQQLAFDEVLRWWEARFHTITLEDRNLPAIAERRVVRPESPDAKRRIDEAFAETTKVRTEVMDAMLTSTADKTMFRQVYPFTPALVQVLVAVSSMLQRERTALKVMLQLLVSQRDTLKLGDLVPVGDLFDAIAEGNEAFNEGMREHFENAQRLWVGKLRPLLERTHGMSEEAAGSLPYDDPKAVAFRSDARLAKTLLLSALAANVEALKALTGPRLAALNHGSFRSPIANQEGSLVIGRLRQWASQIGEIHLTDSSNPTVSVHLSGVDIDAILQQAKHEDNLGNRLRKMRELVFAACGIDDEDALFLTHEFVWRGTRRLIEVVFGNVRDMPFDTLRARGADWRMVIDFPFDQDGRTPADDKARVQDFRSSEDASNTIVWIPSFFSRSSLQDLGQLVLLDYVLAGDRFSSYATHLQPGERTTARTLLENQRTQLAAKLRLTVQGAYGVATPIDGSIDSTMGHSLAEHFQSLDPGFRVQPPVAADMLGALEHLLDQALRHQFPRHPMFEVEGEIRLPALRRVLEQVRHAVQEPGGRLFVEQLEMRRLMHRIAVPLQLGEMGELHFVLGLAWVQHFQRKLAETGETRRVGTLRSWIDDPQPRGLPTELANLVILAYAEQQNLKFVLHDGPSTATLESLRDDLELREAPLPAPAIWSEARTRASTLFGLTPLELRTASNVSEVATALKEKGRLLRPDASGLVSALKQVCDARGLAFSEGKRSQTAVAAHELVAALDQSSADHAVEALAAARLVTSAAAMAKSLTTAVATTAALQRTRWSVIDAAMSLSDARQADAQRLNAKLRELLDTDEYASALAPALDRVEADAARLLASPPPAPLVQPPPITPPPIAPPSPAGRSVIEQAPRRSVAGDEARQVLARIATVLEANPRAQLTIEWTVEKGRDG